MEELINQFYTVTGFEASCSMNKEQQEEYFKLNKLYNRATKTHFNYSICRKNQLISKVDKFINDNK